MNASQAGQVAISRHVFAMLERETFTGQHEASRGMTSALMLCESLLLSL